MNAKETYMITWIENRIKEAERGQRGTSGTGVFAWWSGYRTSLEEALSYFKHLIESEEKFNAKSKDKEQASERQTDGQTSS